MSDLIRLTLSIEKIDLDHAQTNSPTQKVPKIWQKEQVPKIWPKEQESVAKASISNELKRQAKARELE